MSTVKCIVCGKESRKFDAFSNLTLPLPSHTNRCSLWVSTKETSIKSYERDGTIIEIVKRQPEKMSSVLV